MACANGEIRQTVYDAFGQMIAEYAGGTWQRDYVYRGGQLVATVDAAGVQYVISDLQGSTRVTMNDSGGIISRHDYLPFGEELQTGTGLRSAGQGYGGADQTRKPYAQMEREAVEGLDHARWRKYESTSGRWTTPDPYRGSMRVNDPQSFNRYAYVENDPVNFVDPTGLDDDDVIRVYTTVIVVNVYISLGGRNWGGGGSESGNEWQGKNPNADTLQKYLWGFENGLQNSTQQPPPEELVHCDKDVQEKIDEISGISNRGKGGGGIKREAGFRIDPGGAGSSYKLGPVITGQYSNEVSVPVIPQVTMAVIHTHPDGAPFPSGPDIRNANKYGYVIYAKTNGGLYLYNPKDPKDANGKTRIIKAPTC